MYDEDMEQSGATINFHLLESNRISSANLYDSNFHIFYFLLFGLTCDLSKRLCLDPFTSYNVSRVTGNIV